MRQTLFPETGKAMFRSGTSNGAQASPVRARPRVPFQHGISQLPYALEAVYPAGPIAVQINKETFKVAVCGVRRGVNSLPSIGRGSARRSVTRRSKKRCITSSKAEWPGCSGNVSRLYLGCASMASDYSFGAETLLHALLIAKATSLPAWMQLLHPVATIIAKSKLLVHPVYPAAWPQARRHPFGASKIIWGSHFTTLYFVRKTRYRYWQFESAFAEAGKPAGMMASSFELRHLFDLLLGAPNSTAATIGLGLRNIAAKAVGVLASIPLFGRIVRHYADHYDEASQRPAELFSNRVSGLFSRWSVKFSAEYYEAKEREEAGKSSAKA